MAPGRFKGLALSRSSSNGSGQGPAEAQQQQRRPHRQSTMVQITPEELDMAKRGTDLWLKVVEGALLPPLEYKDHKGASGKICVIGGSRDYTGAPYFAATAALRMVSKRLSPLVQQQQLQQQCSSRSCNSGGCSAAFTGSPRNEALGSW
ncbi:hypothetical protein Esti_006412 [Eimeria stiedai]